MKSTTATAEKLTDPGISDGRDPLLKMLDTPQDLPSLPTILQQIQTIINDPKSSGNDVKNVIERDPTMTAAVLKLINSAYYAIPGGVSNLQRAIAYLGYDSIYQIAIAVSVVKSFKATDYPAFKLGDFWTHSLGVATWAEQLGKSLKHPKASDMFTAGLLHDLGKVFVAKHDSDRFIKVVTDAFTNKKTFFEAEQAILPLTHNLIGERLATHWRLPRAISSAMKFHHEHDSAKRVGLVPEENQIVDTVILANAMAHKNKMGNSGYPSRDELPTAVMQRLNVNDAVLARTGEQVAEKMKAAGAFLSLLK